MMRFFSWAESLGFDSLRGGCVYRGGKDVNSPVRCSIGCLIPDEIYAPEFENRSFYSLFNYGEVEKLFSRNDIAFFGDIQIKHDEIAKRNGLSDNEKISLFQEFLAGVLTGLSS